MFSLFEFLQHATLKIECVLNNGNTASGTGFFYQFVFDDEAASTVIITNKHVVEDAHTGLFKLTALGGDGKPNYKDQTTVTINDFESGWIMHPDENIDLCLFPMSRILSEMEKQGKEPCFAPIRAKEMPDYTNLGIYKPTEEIHMVGYPNGLGDEQNNLPLIRKGITATPFYIDHNGETEFLIDCACFPGSSGSPVLIVNEGSYSLHKQPLQAGNRMVLLGILHAGPDYDAQGELQKYKVPTNNVVLTNIPMNLGYCIQSKRILDFIPILEELKARE
ncbi:trypsin-like peptidase domain-containing protein [Fulvivirga sp. 29W222]|uniref:Trypsin-like peptidase domain-containing protein n=1 Tax=Fulvivirga marina TaxID=2494733 RepID=A0A937KD55_9BACT|nr:serine protease [Fulvivirga marina]MBL6445685.1 trypsin-like peptidase domain-containing protein [Fulvivirga marina]